MFAMEKSELFAALIGMGVLAVLGCWRLLVWIKTAPVKPDPWDDATEAAVQAEDAVPVCHHCLTPVPPDQWFCKHCGAAVGPYNNWMPYVHVFSEGEVLRNGVLDRVRRSPITIVGYVLLSLAQYLIFAPVFWFFLFRHWRQVRAEEAASPWIPES
jgi:hypothetical protein